MLSIHLCNTLGSLGVIDSVSVWVIPRECCLNMGTPYQSQWLGERLGISISHPLLSAFSWAASMLRWLSLCVKTHHLFKWFQALSSAKEITFWTPFLKVTCIDRSVVCLGRGWKSLGEWSFFFWFWNVVFCAWHFTDSREMITWARKSCLDSSWVKTYFLAPGISLALPAARCRDLPQSCVWESFHCMDPISRTLAKPQGHKWWEQFILSASVSQPYISCSLKCKQ